MQTNGKISDHIMNCKTSSLVSFYPRTRRVTQSAVAALRRSGQPEKSAGWSTIAASTVTETGDCAISAPNFPALFFMPRILACQHTKNHEPPKNGGIIFKVNSNYLVKPMNYNHQTDFRYDH